MTRGLAASPLEGLHRPGASRTPRSEGGRESYGSSSGKEVRDMHIEWVCLSTDREQKDSFGRVVNG